jgi:hypothetical protein
LKSVGLRQLFVKETFALQNIFYILLFSVFAFGKFIHQTLCENRVINV